ncbi:MAG: hypothetical protein C5B53_04850 [Candidatus Melainabacteria bacterium]|nr:MAG: hypothetical protein C5B53_04850 [Candidatus Melainabacteria bacterium]
MATAKPILISLVGKALLVLPLTSILVCSPAMSDTQPGSTGDEKLLRSQADDYAKAFAAGNSKALADMWSSEGTFTDSEGREFRGRTAIEQFFASNFARYGKQPLVINVESIRFPTDGVAIEEGQTCTQQGNSLGNVSHYEAVHAKENGRWQMEAVTETECPKKFSDSLQDLAWLIGTWSAKCSPSSSIHLKADWAANHNFIRCTYGNPSADGEQSGAMTIIGRNPINGRIISWHFDSKGGSGSGKWLRDGQSWTERTTSVEPDGAMGSATYIIHKLDDNTFTWRSVDRSIAGAALPDRQELTVTRDGSK